MKPSFINITLIVLASALGLFSLTIVVAAFFDDTEIWLHKRILLEGTTFNGLLGPFIGLTSSFLVFLSFKAQIDANRKLQERNDKLFKIERIRFSKDLSESVILRIKKIEEKFGINVDYIDVKHTEFRTRSERISKNINRFREKPNLYDQLESIALCSDVESFVNDMYIWFGSYLKDVKDILDSYDDIIYSFDRVYIKTSVEAHMIGIGLIKGTFMGRFKLIKLLNDSEHSDLFSSSEKTYNLINTYYEAIQDWLLRNKDTEIDNLKK